MIRMQTIIFSNKLVYNTDTYIHIALVLRSICFVNFCFKSPCQYIQILNLRPLIFDLTLVGWLYPTSSIIRMEITL